MAGNRPTLETFKNKNVLKQSVKVGLAGAALSGLIFNGMGAANADTQIWVGGCGDTGSQYPVDRAVQDGRYNPADKNIQIQYPASMAPICADPGNTNTGDSIAQGGQAVVDAYYANRNDRVKVEGFSLGAGVVDWAAMKLAADNGGVLPSNVDITSISDGWNPVGIQNHPLAKVIQPITHGMLGIPTTQELHPVPGVREVMDAGDAFATMNVAPFNIGEDITKFARIGQDHRIPNIGNEPYTEVQRDGVTYQIYGNDGNSAVNQAIQEAGVDPGPVGTPFFNFITPQSNPANVLDPPAPLPQSGPVVPDLNIVGPAPRDVLNPPVQNGPLHLDAPSFPGELACVAPDGSEYWTPGTDPC